MPAAQWSWRWRVALQARSLLEAPCQDNLSALIHESTFKALVGEAVFSKARVIVRLGKEGKRDSGSAKMEAMSGAYSFLKSRPW
jgi:hypothetical protein